MTLSDSLRTLHSYCAKQGYKGYSLYDSHTGKIPFEKFGHTISFLANQVIKRSPINIRPLIGVPKAYNPKGMGLFLHSYSLLKSNGKSLISDDELDFFCNWLLENHSKGWSGLCWGYHYDWPRSDGSMFRAHTPSVVVTAFILRGMQAYGQAGRSIDMRDITASAAKFVLNDVYRTDHPEGVCFSYTPAQRDTVFNANLLAAEILSMADHYSGDPTHTETIRKVLEFTLHHQNPDGSWYYSLHPKTGKPKNQIDFHQGYMVETIDRILRLVPSLRTTELDAAIDKGLQFYKNQQFDSDGRAYWRYPDMWPIDIHNQSQGIITFALFADRDSTYAPLAKTIAAWTIQNMQDKKGQFYYQKWPFIMNKTPYMRWNQGWMMLALTTLVTQDLE